MNELSPKVILIMSEEGGFVDAMENWYYLWVLDPRVLKVYHKPAEFDPPLPQLLSLIMPDVLIQQIHAARRKSSKCRRRPRVSSSERRAS